MYPQNEDIIDLLALDLDLDLGSPCTPQNEDFIDPQDLDLDL